MSMVAIMPIALVASANTTLELAGFGPNNFSVAAYSTANPAPTFAAFHSWDDTVFETAVQALAGVIVNIGTLEITTDVFSDNPVLRTKKLIELQGAQWGDQAAQLPNTGNITKGALYRFNGAMWWVIQTFNRTTYNADPATYPALIRKVRSPIVATDWVQPIDQYDSYKLVNAFTGKPDVCRFTDGKVYATKIDNNVYSPSGYPAGWQVQ